MMQVLELELHVAVIYGDLPFSTPTKPFPAALGACMLNACGVGMPTSHTSSLSDRQ